MKTGGQILVETLIAFGARCSFGVPGESYLAVLDALHDVQDRHKFILCRQEGGAGFAASAYGKLTGMPGICWVTRGPGAMNAAIGVHTARQDSSPMLLFVGQVGTNMMGREAFQEVDYRAVFGTLAKWAVEIEDASRIPEIVARAWKTAVSGRPGPVVIALPEDMLRSKTAVHTLKKPAILSEAAPSLDALKAMRAQIAQAQRPLILIGGSNWNAEGRAALRHFAEGSDIPVIAAFRYQDQFDNHSSCFIGEAGVGMPSHVKQSLSDADFILAINNRFGENSTDGYRLFDVPSPQQKVIHVHPDDAEIGKVYVPHLAIQAGANEFVKCLEPISGAWAAWRSKARVAYEQSLIAPEQPSPVDMGEVMRYLQEHLPEDVIITNGAGNFAIWPNKFFAFGTKATLLAPQSGAMGYGIPAALAAQIAAPDRMVLCFAGDGDFQMTGQELASAVQAGARLIVLVLNNNSYGTIRMHQERHYPARVSGTELANPDFAYLARAYGMMGERVATTAEFAAVFERALRSPKGAVLELMTSVEALSPRQSLSAIRDAALKS